MNRPLDKTKYLVGDLLDTKRGLESDFAAFWQAYPRRVAKLAAWRAYQRARRTVDAETILAGVRRYVEYVEQRGTEPEYIAHPATWLNAGRWDDEYERPQRGVDRALALAVRDRLDPRRDH